MRPGDRLREASRAFTSCHEPPLERCAWTESNIPEECRMAATALISCIFGSSTSVSKAGFPACEPVGKRSSKTGMSRRVTWPSGRRLRASWARSRMVASCETNICNVPVRCNISATPATPLRGETRNAVQPALNTPTTVQKYVMVSTRSEIVSYKGRR